MEIKIRHCKLLGSRERVIEVVEDVFEVANGVKCHLEGELLEGVSRLCVGHVDVVVGDLCALLSLTSTCLAPWIQHLKVLADRAALAVGVFGAYARAARTVATRAHSLVDQILIIVPLDICNDWVLASITHQLAALWIRSAA